MREKELNDLEIELLELKIQEHRLYRKYEIVKSICLTIAVVLFGVLSYSYDLKVILSAI